MANDARLSASGRPRASGNRARDSEAVQGFEHLQSIADHRDAWCSRCRSACNTCNTQGHAAASITKAGTATEYMWKGRCNEPQTEASIRDVQAAWQSVHNATRGRTVARRATRSLDCEDIGTCRGFLRGERCRITRATERHGAPRLKRVQPSSSQFGQRTQQQQWKERGRRKTFLSAPVVLVLVSVPENPSTS